jgi:mRNA-degrading endonuclease RelE of RelBE toxin-antitoxin system
MYKDIYSEEITKKLIKIKKKHPKLFIITKNKINQIISEPNHKYRELRHTLKGIRRVHIGHFVLIFKVNHKKRIICFEDFEHHDKIYL